NREGPRQLEAAQIGIPEHPSEVAPRCAQPTCERTHRRTLPRHGVVLNEARREDSPAVARLDEVSGTNPRPEGGSKMSEEEKEKVETEESDDVEAHRRRMLPDEPAEQEDDESDDVEAHRRRA